MAGIFKYSDLLPEAKGVAPNCPENELLFQFRRAMQEFCEVSRGWMQWIEFNETEDEQTYALTPQANADVLDVVEVRVKAADSTNDFDFGCVQHPATWRFNRVSTNPFLVLSWTPQSSGERIIRARCALSPSSTASEVDDAEFFGRWHRAVLAKALYETLKQKRPWRNDREAEDRRKEYWNLVADAKSEARLAQYGANLADGMTA